MKKNAGFTLIELMVVLVIMGVLAAIAGPNIQAAMSRQNVKKAATELS